MQLGERAGYGEGELRAGAKPRVRGDGAVDDEVHACAGSGQAVMPGEAARELEGAVGVGAFGRKRRGGAGLEQERRRRHRRAHAAEAAAQVAAQVEDAEVEARRRLDEDGARRAHDAAG